MILATAAALTAVSLQLPAQADQKNMRDALRDLNNARESLEDAKHNKGGHRVKAIEFIDKAIREVEKGIKSAR